MPQLSFVTVDVFTTTRYAGNPLAIVKVPRGNDISTEQMQTIAREFNLSETVFLHESTTSDSNGAPEWNVRIFMTAGELPFAGHPTIGTACFALMTVANNAPKGRLICKAGPIEVEYKSGVARAAIPHNIHVHTEKPFTADEVHRLQPNLLTANAKLLDINVVSPVRGMQFVYVELPDLATLAKLENTGVRPDPALDQAWNVGFSGSLYYVLTDGPIGTSDEPVKVRTRMLEGNFEDPATGSAACALGAYLSLKAKRKNVRFEVTQGVEMGRKSDIGISVVLKDSLDAVESIELSGSAVTMMEGMIEY